MHNLNLLLNDAPYPGGWGHTSKGDPTRRLGNKRTEVYTEAQRASRSGGELTAHLLQ